MSNTTTIRINDLATRTARQEKWLERLNDAAANLRLEFAKATEINDTNKIERLTEEYINKCKFIAHVELTLIQQKLEKARLIRSTTAKY